MYNEINNLWTARFTSYSNSERKRWQENRGKELTTSNMIRTQYDQIQADICRIKWAATASTPIIRRAVPNLFSMWIHLSDDDRVYSFTLFLSFSPFFLLTVVEFFISGQIMSIHSFLCARFIHKLLVFCILLLHFAIQFLSVFVSITSNEHC